jgi:recombination protein RecA
MSQALRKITGALHQSKTTAIFINQLREKIGVFFGSPETTTGGKALKFYASVRLDVRRIETLKDGQDAVGNRTRVKVVKNKVAPPFKQAEFDIIYGVGISREGSLIDLGVECDVVKKSGAWYTYEGDQLGQGKENARAFLIDNPDLANEIEQKIRAVYSPVEVDPAMVKEIEDAAADVDF